MANEKTQEPIETTAMPTRLNWAILRQALEGRRIRLVYLAGPRQPHCRLEISAGGWHCLLSFTPESADQVRGLALALHLWDIRNYRVKDETRPYDKIVFDILAAE